MFFLFHLFHVKGIWHPIFNNLKKNSNIMSIVNIPKDFTLNGDSFKSLYKH